VSTDSGTTPEVTAERDRWGAIVAYALVAAATQMLWLTFAAITTDSAHSYHVSVGAIGVLSEIFLFVFVVLAIPAGRLLDRRFHITLTVGALLVAAGGLVRIIGPTYATALLGQILVSVAQPLVLSAATKLAVESLSEPSRPTGIAVGSAGNFVGMVLAVILGPALEHHGHLGTLLLVEGVLSVPPAVWLAIELRRAPRAADDAEFVVMERRAARTLWRDGTIRTVCGLVFLGFGIFVAIATWLQTLLHPAGVSDHAAGLLLTAMILAGVVGCAVFPPVVARRAAERRYVYAVLGVTCVACLALATGPAIGIRAALLVAIGLVLLPALPITLVIAEQRSGRHLAGTAGALLWMAGNLGGLAVSLLVQIFVHHAAVAFVEMAVVALLCAPFARRLRTGPAQRRTIEVRATG
jgi:predicted MFS family arabinose efflux permease